MARILLGVSGGIAAYKAVEVVRLATAAGHSVRVIQTPAAQRFVGAATFEGVTGAPVLVEEFERDPARGAFPGDAAADHDAISHLELVRRCDVFAVVPASANTLAKLAGGLADNLLSSAALASTAPLVLAPAMNNHMWEHPATRANLERLEERGARVVQPETGRLASEGEWGEGRLADPAEVFAAIEAALGSHAPSPLLGRRVLVTAGGTREPIDPVRFVGNRSSGRMGVALADEAARRGAEVTLIAANLSLPAPERARVIEVSTAAELAEAARAEFPDADVLLMAAAVADYRPREAGEAKLKKADSDSLSIELEATEDVLATLGGSRRDDQTVVGFAAEHGGDPRAEARRKLREKGADAIVLNDVSGEGVGFESADNEVVVVTADGEREVPKASKDEVAAAVLDAVEELRAGWSQGVSETPEQRGERVYDLFQKGSALLEAGDFAAAAIPLEQARDLEPDKTSIREALGRAYFRSARFEHAREEFAAVVERSPVDHYSHFCLGRSLEKTGHPVKARRHAALAVGMRPDREDYRAFNEYLRNVA